MEEVDEQEGNEQWRWVLRDGDDDDDDVDDGYDDQQVESLGNSN